MSDQHALFPVFMKLAGRRVLLVGGGNVAAGKLGALLEAGAEVTVVAPAIGRALARTDVTLIRREFVPSDLDGVSFVVAAAPPPVNREVASYAEVRGLFVNAVDDPAHASAYLGGVVRRDGITLAISTDGAAPALAGLLREAFDALLPRELGAWMGLARHTRRRWKAQQVPMASRRPLLLDALNRLYEPKDWRT